jgi:hypothetical protein
VPGFQPGSVSHHRTGPSQDQQTLDECGGTSLPYFRILFGIAQEPPSSINALLPTPHPEELLYSVLARYRDRMRFPSEKTVLERVFGSRTMTAPVELTGRIDAMVAGLPPDHPLAADSLLRRHTTLPYYAPFLGAGRLHDVVQRLRTGTAQGAAEALGLRASTVVSPTHLQFCKVCREADLESNGEPYWRRAHQLPGVLLCPEHSVPLWRSAIRRREPAQRHVFHSLGSAPQEGAAPIAFAESGCPALPQIAEDTAWLLTLAPTGTGGLEVNARYKGLLEEQGWIRSRKQIRMADLRAAFAGHYGPRLLAYVGCKLSSLTGDHDWLARLVRKPRGAQHPLHHILLIRFLGLSAEEFFSAPIVRTTRPPPSTRECLPVQRVASSNGSHRATSNHREVWLKAIAEHPQEGITALRKRYPATYAYLYRSDRDWLDSHRPPRPVWKSRAPRVDWMGRDVALAERVKAITAELLAEFQRPTRLSPARVMRRVGEASMLAQHPDRLPLTREALQAAAETRLAFARRKIQWAAELYRTNGLRPAPWQLARSAALRPDLVGELSEEIALLCQGFANAGASTGTYGPLLPTRTWTYERPSRTSWPEGA